MRLYIHGIGTMTLGLDEPFGDGMACLSDIPIKDYAPLAKRRRFGQLTKLFYVAGLRAVADAQVADPAKLAIVGATALGEASAALKLLTQIQKSRGRLISPNLVPNSVHNAPAGHLTIGMENKMPSVTISQGRLSGEAALSAAADLLDLGQANQVLIVAGDEAQPTWAEELETLGATAWATQLDRNAYQEGAVALVVGREPGGRKLGSIISHVVRTDLSPEGLSSVFKAYRIDPGKDASIRVRLTGGRPEITAQVAHALKRNRDTVLDGAGPGIAQAGSFVDLVKGIEQLDLNELLSLSFEADELAFLYWVR